MRHLKTILCCCAGLAMMEARAWQQQDAILYFLQQDTAANPAYAAAAEKLQRAINKDSTDPLYHYYQGYAYDRLNSPNAEFIPAVSLPGSVNASNAFEKVIALSPTCNFPLYKSDPYTKISAIWGSLFFHYALERKPDSAHWALLEGKRRGGFLPAVLAYARETLMNADTNGIIIGTGDNFTFPLLYVQQIEGWRKDVQVVDANLLNTSWYAGLLPVNPPLLSYAAAALATIDYIPWQEQQIQYELASDTLAWLMKPTYAGNYILRSDRLLLNMLQQQWSNRPFYFVNPADSAYSLFLEDLLISEGLLSRLDAGAGRLPAAWRGYQYNFLSRYQVTIDDSLSLTNSPDAVQLLNGYRFAYIGKIAEFLHAGSKDDAAVIFRQMQNQLPIRLLPYDNTEMEQYLLRLEQYLNQQ